ncbi:LAFA_0C06018g1_1 [Lachancea sp. 'fantastica']|nr:LAFA_0C06018g1_1 [Lachancea sp. 'fantastica']
MPHIRDLSIILSKGFRRSISSSIDDCSILRTSALINGHWRKGEQYTVKNASTSEELCKVTNCGIKDCQDAIKAAKTAFKSYHRLSTAERSQILTDIYDLIQEHSLDLARLLSLESGKAFQSSMIDITNAASWFQFFSKEASRPSANSEMVLSPHPRVTLQVNQPVGVLAFLPHWSFPAAVSRNIAATIATGNTCVVQPAQETPLTSLALAYLCTQAGLPNGVCNVLPSTQRPTFEKLLLKNKAVHRLVYIGPHYMGKNILNEGRGSGSLEKISLYSRDEVPFIVSDTANVQKAVQDLIQCRFRLSDQEGSRISRVFVHASIYDEFARKLVSLVESTSCLGDPFAHKVTYGPLSDPNETQKLSELIEDAKDKGACVLCGGVKAESLGAGFFRPTVLSNVTQEMKIVQKEFYGPIASLEKFDSLQSVFSNVNREHIGSAAYLYSSDSKSIFKIAAELHVAILHINTAFNNDYSGMNALLWSSDSDNYVKTKALIWEP